MDTMDVGFASVFLAIATAIGTAAWKASNYLANRFFNDETGYVPQYLRKHYEFLDGLAERDKAQGVACGEHVQVLSVTSHDVISIKQAGLEACHLCREMMGEPEGQTKVRLDNIERVLTES